jgi:peroxiredoxin
MTATLCLLGCLLAPAQSPDRPAAPPRAGDGVLARLAKGQELVYRGTFTEDSTGDGVQFSRAYRVETRLFVLDAPAGRGAEVAVLTVLKNRDPLPGQSTASSVRLEVVRVDAKGKITGDPGVALVPPLEGPPSIECGAIAPAPDGRAAVGQTWPEAETGRPLRDWEVVGTEMVSGVSCLKLVGVQKSDDWDRPRADRTAWRRQDTVWVAPRLGAAARVERKIERREPARREPTYHSVMRYELEEPMQYPGELFEQREREIRQARSLAEAAAPLLSTPAKYGPDLEALMNRINYHLERQHATPYREAVLQVKRRVEAAQRGETPPAPPSDDGPEAGHAAEVGAVVPDFSAPDFATGLPTHLRHWSGRPVLLVFYNPSSPTSPEVLRFAQKMSTANPRDLAVVALSMSEDADLVKKQRADLNLTLPVLNGAGLRVSYAVEGTPKLLLLDANGVVRGTYLGWGRDTPAEVAEEVRHWTGKH